MNLKHQAALATTAELVADLRADIDTQLQVLTKLVDQLEDLAGTRQPVGLGFMTPELREARDKQTQLDRAAARGLVGLNTRPGLDWLNPVVTLGAGQVAAPVSIAAVSALAEIRATTQHHIRRLTRPAVLQLLEREQTMLEDHQACPWPRHPLHHAAVDTETRLLPLLARLGWLTAAYANRPGLQEILRDLDHLEHKARDVIDGPAKTNHPDPCPWCGHTTLVMHHRIDGHPAQVIRCEGPHPCECTHGWCDCHRNPHRHRHEWINSGRAADTGRSPKTGIRGNTWHALHKLQELARMETQALDAIGRIRALHAPLDLYPLSSNCTNPDVHADAWIDPRDGSTDQICITCPPAVTVCAHCRDQDGAEVTYPCPTIETIDNHQED